MSERSMKNLEVELGVRSVERKLYLHECDPLEVVLNALLNSQFTRVTLFSVWSEKGRICWYKMYDVDWISSGVFLAAGLWVCMWLAKLRMMSTKVKVSRLNVVSMLRQVGIGSDDWMGQSHYI